jgi:hypothetical protein
MQRLHQNHGAYRGETVDIRRVLDELETTARATGWDVKVFHSTNEFKWLALHRPASASPPPQPKRIYLSAGIHGDEPAGPLAILRLIAKNQWPPDAEIICCPCLNPAGFAANRRENQDGVDLNRDYLRPTSAEIAAHLRWLEPQLPFTASLCLHEDWEAHGFYVYELNPDERPSLAEAMVAAVERVCPIDRSELIEGRPANEGIIRPCLDPSTRPQWPEAFWLITHKTRLSYTLEAPSDFPLATRVNALVTGVQAALAALQHTVTDVNLVSLRAASSRRPPVR